MQQQPPWQTRLTVWSHLWRFALAALVSTFVWGSISQGQWQDHRWMFWLDIGLGVVAWVAVCFRRRWPLPVALLTIVLSVYSGIAAGPSLLASVSLATRRVVWQIVIAGVVGLVCAQAFLVVQPQQGSDPYWVNLTANTIISIAVLALGMYVGSRRGLLGGRPLAGGGGGVGRGCLLVRIARFLAGLPGGLGIGPDLAADLLLEPGELLGQPEPLVLVLLERIGPFVALIVAIAVAHRITSPAEHRTGARRAKSQRVRR